MSFNRVIVATALFAGMGVAAAGLSGCTSTQKALGMSKVTPDEFRIVTKAPLVVPPDYALRPPAPGEPRPQELQPESAARNALLDRAALGQVDRPARGVAASRGNGAGTPGIWRHPPCGGAPRGRPQERGGRRREEVRCRE